MDPVLSAFCDAANMGFGASLDEIQAGYSEIIRLNNLVDKLIESHACEPGITHLDGPRPCFLCKTSQDRI